jgi:cyclopropane fatty-acyl-phospholipid synthase-like methyltransferase
MLTYNKIYKNHAAAWGKGANTLVRKACRSVKEKDGAMALDLGCGQGRDSFFLASKGFRVTAVDSSAVAARQIREKIKRTKNARLKMICKNVADYRIRSNAYDLIVGIDILQFLKSAEVAAVIKNMQTGLKRNGIVVLSSFTTRDPSYKKETLKNIQHYFKPKELAHYFKNFASLYYSENVITDPGHASMPFPHKHGIVEMIARKL